MQELITPAYKQKLKIEIKNLLQTVYRDLGKPLLSRTRYRQIFDDEFLRRANVKLGKKIWGDIVITISHSPLSPDHCTITLEFRNNILELSKTLL